MLFVTELSWVLGWLNCRSWFFLNESKEYFHKKWTKWGCCPKTSNSLKTQKNTKITYLLIHFERFPIKIQKKIEMKKRVQCDSKEKRGDQSKWPLKNPIWLLQPTPCGICRVVVPSWCPNSGTAEGQHIWVGLLWEKIY